MPAALTKTATIIGIDAQIIEVEADVSIGIGVFNSAGLPDGTVNCVNADPGWQSFIDKLLHPFMRYFEEIVVPSADLTLSE
ncbi:MAG: hypothetical protein MJE63_12490 [Proteobacteria bacterium]|nr:hypothetical protein [Pseudomonadota bacterium]